MGHKQLSHLHLKKGKESQVDRGILGNRYPPQSWKAGIREEAMACMLNSPQFILVHMWWSTLFLPFNCTDILSLNFLSNRFFLEPQGPHLTLSSESSPSTDFFHLQNTLQFVQAKRSVTLIHDICNKILTCPQKAAAWRGSQPSQSLTSRLAPWSRRTSAACR